MSCKITIKHGEHDNDAIDIDIGGSMAACIIISNVDGAQNFWTTSAWDTIGRALSLIFSTMDDAERAVYMDEIRRAVDVC